jgi:N-acetylglucosaminyl-diphospho-decaprenol L-rhamnosyltransferase
MISVIVPTADGDRWLELCIPALDAQVIDELFEIIVVEDGTRSEAITKLSPQFPRMRVVRTNARAGFAAACNLGARESRGELLAFLNDDTRPHPRWLSRLAAALRGRDDAGMAASLIVGFGGETIDSAGDGYLRCGGAFKRDHGEPARDMAAGERRTGETFGACGAAFMIRRPLFEALGGFDEDYEMVHEDVDLSYRGRLRGAACVFVPDAIVEHAGSASLGVLSTRAVYLGQRNLEWTYLKNTPASLLWRTLASHAAYGAAAGIGYALSGHGWTFLKAKAAAAAGVPAILRKRRAVQRGRQVPADAIAALMDRDWVLRKYREKRFARARRDAAQAGSPAALSPAAASPATTSATPARPLAPLAGRPPASGDS